MHLILYHSSKYEILAEWRKIRKCSKYKHKAFLQRSPIYLFPQSTGAVLVTLFLFLSLSLSSCKLYFSGGDNFQQQPRRRKYRTLYTEQSCHALRGNGEERGRSTTTAMALASTSICCPPCAPMWLWTLFHGGHSSCPLLLHSSQQSPGYSAGWGPSFCAAPFTWESWVERPGCPGLFWPRLRAEVFFFQQILFGIRDPGQNSVWESNVAWS